MSNGQHDQLILSQRRRRLGELTKYADKVAPNGVEGSKLGAEEGRRMEGKGVFGDRYHGLVVAEEEPVPDAGALGVVEVRQWRRRGVCGNGSSADVVKGVVA